MCPADHDRNAAMMRRRPIHTVDKRGWAWMVAGRLSGTYQRVLKPADRLLLATPFGVSLTDPVTVTPPNSFCSAPIRRSHLLSTVECVWPAMKLVPVSAMPELGGLIDFVNAR